jgi:Neuraminidase (sialidase)
MLLLSVGVFSGQASAQTSSEMEANGELVAASGSNRFVVWQDDTPGNNEILFRRSTDNGATWKPVVNLSSNPGSSHDAQIAVSGSRVYVVWSQENAEQTTSDIFIRRSTDNGASWGSKINLSDNAGFSDFPLIRTSSDNVYVAWEERI